MTASKYVIVKEGNKYIVERHNTYGEGIVFNTILLSFVDFNKAERFVLDEIKRDKERIERKVIKEYTV